MICPKEIFENLYARTEDAEKKSLYRFRIEMPAAEAATAAVRATANNNSNAISYTKSTHHCIIAGISILFSASDSILPLRFDFSIV